MNEKIETDGIIFINGEFIDLSFKEKSVQQESVVEKKDDLAIVVQYTSHVFSKKYAYITMKIFDEEQNKLNNFSQKDGRLPNVNINVLVLDGDNNEFYSSNGTTDEKGFFEARFWIPDNYKRDSLTATIDAENENSKSSKILQMFTIGKETSSSTSGP